MCLTVDPGHDDKPTPRTHLSRHLDPRPKEAGDVLALIGSPDDHDISRSSADNARIDTERRLHGRSDIDDRDPT
jgi:hypothetical protein